MLLQLLIFSGHTQGVNPSETLILSLLTMTNTQCALSLLAQRALHVKEKHPGEKAIFHHHRSACTNY